MPATGWTICGSTVRFAAAVQAAMEDGYRVFAELAPHPLLTHAARAERPQSRHAAGRSGRHAPRTSAAARAARLRGGSAQCGRRGRLLRALPEWAAGGRAAADLDAPSAAVEPRRSGIPRHTAACTVSVHPLLGAHVRLQEEPERHVWQGEVGTAAQPWLGDHQIRNVAVLPGAAYCEMALAAARAVLGEASEVRDIRFEQALLLDEQTTVGASASLSSPGVRRLHGGDKSGGRTSAASYRGPACRGRRAATCARHVRATCRAPASRGWRRGAQAPGPAWCSVRSGVHRSRPRCTPARGQPAPCWPRSRYPRQIRSQQDAYGVHPALLDACFQSVAAHPDVQALGEDVLGLPLGIRRLRSYGAARNAHYCYTRVTKADTSGIEADLDVLDEHGAVLLAVQGLRLGTGVSESGNNDRVLAERLLTIEWRQRELPEVEYADAGSWLLISTTATADVVATALTDALKNHGAQCTTMCWPPHADHASNSRTAWKPSARRWIHRCGDPHGTQKRRRRGPVPAAGPRVCAASGAHHPRIAGDPWRAASPVRRDPQRPDGAGRRRGQPGAGWAAGLDPGDRHRTSAPARHPDRCGRSHRRRAAGAATARRVRGRRDRLAKRRSGTRRGCPPLRCAPRSGSTTVADHERDGMRLQIRTPGDLESMELVACDRVPPGPGQIEVAVSASSINFADVLVAFGRYPAFDGRLPQLGTDFAGVVTAVGPDVTDHKVGDHVGGLSANGCWAHVHHLRRAPGRHAAAQACPTSRRPR